MKWTALLTLVLIGLVAGDGAWEKDREYRYKLQARTFLPLRETDNKYVGVVSRAYLTIRPQSENVLIGQISQAEYGEVDQQLSEIWNLDLNDRQVAYNQWRLNEPFKINLENGAIRSLSVDRTMTDYERNQLKVIVSQFQVDTNAQYKMEYDDNLLPQGDNNNALYKTMEPIVTGNCETIYDISPLPDYLVQSNREWVPMPELKEGGEFIQIVKTRNYSNCDVRRGYLYYITGRGDLTQYTNEMARLDLSSSENNLFGRGMSKQYVNQMENDYGNRRTTDRRVFKQYTNQMEEDNSSVSENKRYNTGRGVSRQYTNEMQEDYSPVFGNRQYRNQMEEDDSSVFGNKRYTTDRRGLEQYTNRMEENDMYIRYITGREGLRQYINDMPKDLSISDSRRIIISGSLRKYTIQSSVTTNKVVNSRSNSNDLALYDYVSVTLESVVRRSSDSNLVLLNLMDIGNLVYTYDSEHQPIPMKTSYRTQQYGEWSNCWTWFPSGSNVCKREFGPEFEDISRKTCGFLGMGMQINCRRSFPGCQATPCFSYFIPKSQSCERTFGTELPFTKGGFLDCLPGFYRSRCCSRQY